MVWELLTPPGEAELSEKTSKSTLAGQCGCTAKSIKPSSLALFQCYFVFLLLPFRGTRDLLIIYTVSLSIVSTCSDHLRQVCFMCLITKEVKELLLDSKAIELRREGKQNKHRARIQEISAPAVTVPLD